MGDVTKIQWTDHTFNPWWGCTRVSPGCEHCYAEAFAKRTGLAWGVSVDRRFFADKHWREPEKWNASAEKAGERRRVFCASMADVFEDRRELDTWRDRLWDVIECTPWLDWQLLTKRPENVAGLVPSPWREGWPANIWLGTTVEDQRRADERIPHLLAMPARVRFLSCEPLLGPVALDLDGIKWVIVGGESGPAARPFWLEWARVIAFDCRREGVACFVKQLGGVPVMNEGDWRSLRLTPLLSARNAKRAPPGSVPLKYADPKGGDWDEWPADLRVREFPAVSP